MFWLTCPILRQLAKSTIIICPLGSLTLPPPGDTFRRKLTVPIGDHQGREATAISMAVMGLVGSSGSQ